MSRDIPTDQPLSEADRQYLLDRGALGVIAKIDADNQIPEEADASAEEEMDDIHRRASELVERADAIDDSELFDFDEDDEDDEDDDVSYESWTVKQLKAELGERQLDKNGSKEELVARLRLDDQAIAGTN